MPSMQHADLAAAPFAGLGFDVSTVRLASSALHLTKLELVSEPVVRWIGEEVVQAWGYDLLLLLNQETSGS